MKAAVFKFFISARSVDSGLEALNSPQAKYQKTDAWSTPERSTPKSSRKVFGSIEKSLDKVKNMLTPRRRPNYQINYIENKNMYNVSTTASNNPDKVCKLSMK